MLPGFTDEQLKRKTGANQQRAGPSHAALAPLKSAIIVPAAGSQATAVQIERKAGDYDHIEFVHIQGRNIANWFWNLKRAWLKLHLGMIHRTEVQNIFPHPGEAKYPFRIVAFTPER